MLRHVVAFRFKGWGTGLRRDELWEALGSGQAAASLRFGAALLHLVPISAFARSM